MNKIFKIIPKYCIIPYTCVLIMNHIAYITTKSIALDWMHHDKSTALDKMLPFVPWFVFIYVLAYLQWGIGYLIPAKESRQLCLGIAFSDMFAKVICIAVFLIYPTTIIRPEITGTGTAESLLKLIYDYDTPVNLFPSIHCLESWLCFRFAMKCKSKSRFYKIIMFVFTLLVFMSTVMVKQHVLADIIAGVATAEAGMFLAYRLVPKKIIDGISNDT